MAVKGSMTVGILILFCLCVLFLAREANRAGHFEIVGFRDSNFSQ